MRFFINPSLLYRNRNYRLLYISQFVSGFGTSMTSVALPYQIYQETHSTLMVGLVGIFQLIPLIFTALYGGVLADRHHRRQLLLFAESLLAVGCLLLLWNATNTTTHVWLIFILAAFMSALTGLHRPALDSIVQQMVATEDYAVESSLRMFAVSFCYIAGPAIAGLIIARFGLVATYGADFASFVISLAALLLITNVPKPIANLEESIWVLLKQGCQYAMSRQELLGTYFVDFAAMVFGMPMALFPAIADMHGGAKTLGLLYAAPAVGALFISFASDWTRHIRRHGKAIAISASLWGVAIIIFGLLMNVNIYWGLFFLALAGAFDAVSGIFRQTMWNQVIPNELRGRLAGIEMISYLSGPRLGDAEAGFVAALFGVTASVVSGGALCIVGVGVCCYFLPKLWVYDNTQSL